MSEPRCVAAGKWCQIIAMLNECAQRYVTHMEKCEFHLLGESYEEGFFCVDEEEAEELEQLDEKWTEELFSHLDSCEHHRNYVAKVRKFARQVSRRATLAQNAQWN